MRAEVARFTGRVTGKQVAREGLVVGTVVASSERGRVQALSVVPPVAMVRGTSTASKGA